MTTRRHLLVSAASLMGMGAVAPQVVPAKTTQEILEECYAKLMEEASRDTGYRYIWTGSPAGRWEPILSKLSEVEEVGV